MASTGQASAKASPFEGCWARIKRADQHRKALVEAWNQLRVEDLHIPSVYVHHDGTGVVRLEPKPLPVELSLQLGEMLYQLRSALDGVIYAAVILESGPPANPHRIEFPIRPTKDEFSSASRKLGPLVDKPVGSIVESVQPYSASEVGKILGLLNDWARKDRHRNLHLVGQWHSGLKLDFRLPPSCCVIEKTITTEGFLDSEREVAEFRLAGWKPGAEVNVNVDFLSDIGINEGRAGLLRGCTKAMIEAVSDVVRRIEDCY